MDSGVTCGTSTYTSTSPDLYFRDGKRRTDYVLAYRYSASKRFDQNRRHLFLNELAKQKIEIEVEDCNGRLLGSTSVSLDDTSSTLTQATFVQKIESQLSSSLSSPPPPPPQRLQPPTTIVEDTPQSPNHIPSDKYAESDKPTDNTSPPSSMERYRHKALNDEEILLTPDNLIFVKLHASWEAMTYYAEYLKMRKPLRQYDDASELAYGLKFESPKSKPSLTKDCFNCLRIDEEIIKPITSCYTWPFSMNRQYLFDIPENKDEFFTPVERALVLDYILRRTGYKAEDLVNTDDLYEPSASDILVNSEHDECVDPKNQQQMTSSSATAAKNLGITKLISDGVFLAAYPLHEPAGNTVASTEFNNRILLQNYWASYKMLFKCQPISYIRHYFGEAVAFYFAWLGFYTAWLLPIAILGIFVFLFGLIDLKNDSIIHEVCDLGQSVIMCPLCKSSKCKFWTLDTSCLRTKLMRLVDHEGTVVFAVVMSLWAVIFFEMWKRKQVSLAYHWNVSSLEPMDQPPRPEFMALLNKKCPRRVNPITGYVEPFIPFWRRKIPVILITYSTVLLAVMLTLGFLVSVVLYKLVIKAMLYRHHNPMLQSTAGMIATMTGSCINLVVIFIMKLIYDRMAIKLTDAENHRTQVEYDNSLTLKLYLLQFVNYYSSVFYIAFIQGTTSALPGSEHILIQSTGCDQGDCLFELFIQLVIIMVGKQIFGFIQESLMPVLWKVFFKFRAMKRRSTVFAKVNSTDGENNVVGQKPDNLPTNIVNTQFSGICRRNILCRSDFYMLDPGSRPLFNEYLEMMIQYGFITMFVPAFPLAPLFGLLNNLFEIRGDAKKLVNQYRRPVLERVQTIGIWLTIIHVLASIAIRTNACIIAFTTQFIDRCVYRYSYSPDGSMKGFVNFTLSYMSTNRFHLPTNETYCRYDAYRTAPWSPEPYAFTTVYYHVLAAKFIFVFAFETIGTILTNIIMAAVPDVPKHIRREMYHEANITNAIILNAEVGNQQYNRTITKDVNFKQIIMLKHLQDKLQSFSKPKNRDDDYTGNKDINDANDDIDRSTMDLNTTTTKTNTNNDSTCQTTSNPVVYTFHSYELPTDGSQLTQPSPSTYLLPYSNNLPHIGFSHLESNTNNKSSGSRT
uniref:Anoctamin n=1 Tax=Trichobilharzia regenti TaxID=157069 RepID=A0AA85J5D8_TRIRE|nr:unnamed protein product [Trichobilharzia regenti]